MGNQTLEVLIINSPLFRDKVDDYNEDSLSPLGLGYIATDLWSNGITVELLDAVSLNIPISEILDIVRKKQPEFVAINVFTTNLHLVKEIVESLDKKVKCIVGGLAVKNFYREILSWNTSCFLNIVIGEGDFVVTAIVQERILDVIYQQENKRVISVSVSSIYFPADISNISLDRSFFINQPVKNKYGFNEVGIVTSRGCMYNCAFCSAARSLNKELPIRRRSVKSVEREVRELIEYYNNLDCIRILDDLFLRDSLSVKYATGIFNGVPLTWRSMAHILSFDKLSDKQLVELKKSGCEEVFIGIESGSPRILKKIHKTSNVDLIKQTIKRLLVTGISVKGYFIVGFNTETREDMQMSYNLAEYLKNLSMGKNAIFRTSVFQFRPYHGTELYYDIIRGVDKIGDIKSNDDLSKNIGRRQFNFTGGNFSEVSQEVLKEFIVKINQLN